MQLSDGYTEMPNAIFPDFDPVRTGRSANGSFRLSISAFLIWAADRILLVDTGSAGNFGAAAGRFPESFASCGVAPKDIDTVIITHLHSDHYGGLRTHSGAAAFPNARLVLSAAEWRCVHAPMTGTDMNADKLAGLSRAREAVAPYQDMVDLVGDGDEIADGIGVLALPGHTPGHIGLRLTSCANTALIVGDLIHCADYQLPNPGWSVIYDDDPSQAVETRKETLNRAARDQNLLLGSHLGQVGFSRLASEGQGFRRIDAGAGP